MVRIYTGEVYKYSLPETTETNWEEMYKEVEKSYNQLIKPKRIKEKNEKLMMIEKYLPNDKKIITYKTLSKTYKQKYFIENSKSIDDIINDKELSEKINNILYDLLTPQQYSCVKLYYGLDMTQNNVAKELGISQQVVQEHLNKAINKIRKSKELNKM